MKNEEISPFWEHLAIGMWSQVVEQDRVKGTVEVYEEWPDGQRFRVTLKVVKVVKL